MDGSKVIQEINSIHSQIVRIEKRLFSRWNNLMSMNELCYYTDTNTFLNGIIRDEQPKGEEICLWASRWSHLNDPSENQIGIDLMKAMHTPLDIIELLKNNINKNHSISFSTKFDDLPMWKMYGDNCKGIMLVFDCKQLVNHYDGRLQYCIYENSEYDESFIKTMSKLDLGDQFDKLDHTIKEYIICIAFMMYCSIAKHEKYEYEHEVRVVGCGNTFFDRQSKIIYYRYSNGRVIPYVKEYLPKQVLSKVILGPLSNVELSKDSLKEFLDSKGFNHVDVLSSEIPYRG